MQDILITPKGKTKVLAIAQTVKAKKIFKEADVPEGEALEGHKTHIASLLAWAVSHNLSVDSKVPITIQPLLSQYYPKFEIGEDFSKIDEMIENSNKNLEHLKAIDSFAKKKRQFLFRYFYVNVADGRAFYQITKVTKTRATVTLCDGICLDNYADRVLGEEAVIPLEQAQGFVEQRDKIEELFSKKKGA
jgi:hypothetical protein